MWETNAQPWYYYNSAGESATGSDQWWTMSPAFFYSRNRDAYVFRVRGLRDSNSTTGSLSYIFVRYSTPGIRPVLSLKSCVQVSGGDGSSETPYTVEITSICANSEN